MALRFRRDMTQVGQDQTDMRREIEVVRKKGTKLQAVVGDFTKDIEERKREKIRFNQDIQIAKETLEDLEKRDRRRSPTRLED